MSATLKTWDARYAEWAAPTQPSKVLVEISAHVAVNGRAIDLACGAGRNRVFLAERGLRVVGVDRSQEALRQCRELAERRGVTGEWVQAGLDRYGIPPSAFNVVLCTWYRGPKLYPQIREALKTGGLLIYQAFTRDQVRFGSGLDNPEHLLAPAELLPGFQDWNIIYYREAWIGRGMATMVGRKPAVRASGSAIIKTGEKK